MRSSQSRPFGSRRMEQDSRFREEGEIDGGYDEDLDSSNALTADHELLPGRLRQALNGQTSTGIESSTNIRNSSRSLSHHDDTSSVSFNDTTTLRMAGSGDSVTTFHSQRLDAKWRHKTTLLLQKSDAHRHEQQARRAGHLAAEHFWKLASELSTHNSSNASSTLWYSTKLSEVASAESSFDPDNDDDVMGGNFPKGTSLVSTGSLTKRRRFPFFAPRQPSKKSVNMHHQTINSSNDQDSMISVESSERAMRRGIRRGKREDNEGRGGKKILRRNGRNGSNHSTTGETQDSGFNTHWLFHKIPTPTRSNRQRNATQSPSELTPQMRAKLPMLRNRRRVLDEPEADAWMCGVCGKAFTSLEAADKHEQEHIQLVVESLPWIREEKLQNQMQLQNRQRRNSLDSASVSTANSTTRINHHFMSQPLSNRPERGGSYEQHSSTTSENVAKSHVAKRLSFDLQEPYDQDASLEDGQGPIDYEDDPLRTPTIRNSFGRGGGNEARTPPLSNELLDEVLGGDGDFDNDHQDNSDQLFSHGVDEALQMPDLDTSRHEQRDMTYGRSDEEEKQEIESFLHGSNHQKSNEEQDYFYSSKMHPPVKPDGWNLVAKSAPHDTLVPRLRSEALFYAKEDEEYLPVRHIDASLSENHGAHEPQEALLLSNAVQDYVILADEALVFVCEKAHKFILSPEELMAEKQLSYLAADKAYYDDLAARARLRKRNPTLAKYRSEEKGILGKVNNKFLDAYQLMKDGTDKKGFRDEYEMKMKGKATGETSDQKLVVHNQRTMYLNVMVKNGIQVVKSELERLAQERWENEKDLDKFTRFERFRVYAHMNMVRLAGLALSSDFTPRRIAVQLSNDIYRLLTPRLKKKGVMIETEIEYRVGPYFVLAVNIIDINWRRLIKFTYRDVEMRRLRWKKEQQKERREQESKGDEGKKSRASTFKEYRIYLEQISHLTIHDIVAQVLACLFHTHWLFYQPFCIFLYYTFFGSIIRQFILSSVADEIFYYVEEKGMEMQIGIRKASVQAAFMLSALREIRADSKDHRKKQQQSGDERQDILGPLLGPSIAADAGDASKPPDFEVPENLEFVGLELDWEVGYRRLRWALLNIDSTFLTEALYRKEAKYDNITMGTWNKHSEHIGAPKLPDDVDEADFIGATKEGSYLMPKSAFVKANMCTETHYIVAYNDYCTTLKKKALTPEVPYGSTFVAWTQFTIINTGHHSCRLICSVEPEFPNGPPLVSRQIKSGMRAGVGELFVLIGETIAKYANEYP